jgi:RNA polymerase primary sigma factor
MADWERALRSLLAEHPGLTIHQIRDRMRATGSEPPLKSSLNQYLYGDRSTFRREGPAGSLPRWYLVDVETNGRGHRISSRAAALPVTPAPSSLALYPWQQRALDAWAASGYRGVIEAVTGAGKTRVAIAAIAIQLAAGGRAAVLVHTRELVEQWVRETALQVPPVVGRPLTVGRLGGGWHQTLANVDVLVATAQSASGWQLGLGSTSGLLIADEVHHYGSETWALGLEDGFDRRLGLTATYEREDNGVAAYLDPYFGGVRYSVDYDEALRDKVIASFKIAFVGVQFEPAEALEYADLSDRLRRRKNKLLQVFDIPAEPFGEFIKAVARIARGAGESSQLAGLYLHGFNKRRALLSSCSAKLDRLRELVPAVKAAERTIVFSQTQAAANSAILALEDPELRSAVLHSGMDVNDRRDVFAGFEDGSHDLVAAPRLLDEGVDIPAADLAIVLAASRSKRQMIQRMGRVVRPKEDGRLARLAILFVEETSEDPEEGAHEDFTDVVSRAATDVRVFRSNTPAPMVNRFLSEMHG